MGPHSERESLWPVTVAPASVPVKSAIAASIDLDFDLDGDTQIDVFVLAPGAELPFVLDRDAPPPSSSQPPLTPN